MVVYDELDLAPGKCRVKRGGGSGGHNGIRSIDRHIGPEYWRIRLGIGHPGHKDRVHGYVLHDFAKSDEDWLDPLLEAVADAIPLMAEGEPEKFMTRVAMLTTAAKGVSPTAIVNQEPVLWDSNAELSVCRMSASRPCSTP